jgi:hypothetical protein
VGWLIVIGETLFGIKVPVPLWLMQVAGTMGLGSTVARPTQPELSEYLIVTAGVISIAAVIVIVVMRP